MRRGRLIIGDDSIYTGDGVLLGKFFAPTGLPDSEWIAQKKKHARLFGSAPQLYTLLKAMLCNNDIHPIYFNDLQDIIDFIEPKEERIRAMTTEVAYAN